MSLSIRNRLIGLHPFVSSRVEYILNWASQYGPEVSITSTVRTAQEQWRLFNSPNSLAAQVGCSQHQYGLAADVSFQDSAWQNWYLASARNFGLTTISGDPVHVQAVPGAQFREIAGRAGLCPDPRYPLENRFDSRAFINPFRGSFFQDAFSNPLEFEDFGPPIYE